MKLNEIKRVFDQNHVVLNQEQLAAKIKEISDACGAHDGRLGKYVRTKKSPNVAKFYVAVGSVAPAKNEEEKEQAEKANKQFMLRVAEFLLKTKADHVAVVISNDEVFELHKASDLVSKHAQATGIFKVNYDGKSHDHFGTIQYEVVV